MASARYWRRGRGGKIQALFLQEKTFQRPVYLTAIDAHLRVDESDDVLPVVKLAVRPDLADNVSDKIQS